MRIENRKRARRGTSAWAAVAMVCGSTWSLGADSDALVGVHFWGDRDDNSPATLMDSTTRGGYDLEIVNTGNPQWNDVDVVNPLYANLKNSYNVTPVTRLGYYWGNTLPVPGSAEANNWPSYIANNVLSPLKNTAHVWQLGNEPNLHGEAQGWVNQQITPNQYAGVYQNVRAGIQGAGLAGTAGAHKLLVAPVSPGGAGGDRWMAGTTWLDQTLAAIQGAGVPVDGVALHAYGGGDARASLQSFRQSVMDQIAVIDNRGLTGVPLYITEWNRQTPIGNLSEEAVTADFAKQALAFLNRWNTTPGNHNIVSTNWFVYDGGDGTGTWDTYSIEYWKNHGNPTNSPNSLYNAFFTSARAGYHAGMAGTRPMPTGVTLFDDFETNDGHFAGATPAPSSGGGSPTTTGTISAGSFKVRQNDADSYTKMYAQKIGIADDPANANGWSVRYVSGSGLPGNNTPIPLTSGTDGSVGFFLRVYSANGSTDLSSAGPLTTQIVMDSGSVGGNADSDAGVARTIIADGQWHLYEWSLDSPGDWVPWAPATGSDGKLGTNADFISGNVTIDSIMFQGGNVNVEYLLDGVGRNATGSLNVMQGVPEPGATGLLMGAGALILGRRRKRN
jgi:hypothetical protein